jgi:decaprenylphospho-beta-D-erythro-pentofuranosid-2-ulose 2-reductase
MSTDRKRIAIVGATSGIAEACARIWAEEGGRDFVLYGRRAEALEAISADLRVRDPKAEVIPVVADLADPGGIDALVARAQGDWPLDTVLIAFGVLTDQATLQTDTKALARSLAVNALAPALWAEAFARSAGSAGTRIAVIGSVAGDRGRKSNYAYGAAKGLVEHYVEGMQHRFASGGPVPVLIKPGPTRTAMTAHMDQAKMAPVEQVAREILAGIARGKAVIYTPAKWSIIMAVIRNLPRALFHRMDI